MKEKLDLSASPVALISCRTELMIATVWLRASISLSFSGPWWSPDLYQIVAAPYSLLIHLFCYFTSPGFPYNDMKDITKAFIVVFLFAVCKPSVAHGSSNAHKVCDSSLHILLSDCEFPLTALFWNSALFYFCT